MPGRKKKFDRASCLACAGKTEEDRLILELRAIHRTMNALYEGKGSWKRVLIVLGRTGPITQKALTNRLGIQPGSVSAVLGKMEAMGLITRTPSAADQRTMDLRLTPEGESQAALAADQRAARHREMFACLSSEDKTALLRLLETLNADWEERFAGK